MESISLTFMAAVPPGKLAVPPVLPLLISAGVIVIIVALLRSPFVKGWLGELQVNVAAWMLLDKRQYHLIRNVTVRSGAGTTQIDHVIVSRYGVFVIETKNMSGWIFGTAGDARWTQKFRRRSFTFQNPLRQNFKHTEALAELLGLPREVVKSIIVFVGGARLKREVPANVTTVTGYIRYIRSHTQEMLPEEDVHRVVVTIASIRLDTNFRTHREHVRRVRFIVASKASTGQPMLSKTNVQLGSDHRAARNEGSATAPFATGRDVNGGETPICPRCGAIMVVRTARKGPETGRRFWGCPGFPKCRGVRRIM